MRAVSVLVVFNLVMYSNYNNFDGRMVFDAFIQLLTTAVCLESAPPLHDYEAFVLYKW